MYSTGTEFYQALAEAHKTIVAFSNRDKTEIDNIRGFIADKTHFTATNMTLKQSKLLTIKATK